MNQDEIRDMETAMREFDAFERMYRKSEPVAGGSDLERKNKYWIELGAKRAEERIIKLLEDSITYENFGLKEYLIKKIKGENNE